MGTTTDNNLTNPSRSNAATWHRITQCFIYYISIVATKQPMYNSTVRLVNICRLNELHEYSSFDAFLNELNFGCKSDVDICATLHATNYLKLSLSHILCFVLTNFMTFCMCLRVEH